MPASQFMWETLPGGQVFPVYGTKRKAEDGAFSTHSCQPQDSQEHVSKRRCHSLQLPEMQQPAQDQHCSPPDLGPMINNNSNMTISQGVSPSFVSHCVQMEPCPPPMVMADQQNLHQMQSQLYSNVSHPALNQVLSQQPPRVPSPWPSHQPIHQPISQESLIMDVNGETFSSPADETAEMESVSMDMASQCSPSPEQYQQPTADRPSSSDFCKSYCGIGERSPSSGRVRCYCKPSWEGMLDMKPYISDVY